MMEHEIFEKYPRHYYLRNKINDAIIWNVCLFNEQVNRMQVVASYKIVDEAVRLIYESKIK